MKAALWAIFLSALVTITICGWFWWQAPAYADGRCGTASWYARGHVTASGERFNPDALTAAMWGVPFNSRYRVTYRGKSVVVRITDRGPNRRLHRIIDLSRAAARRIGLRGVGRVCLSRM